MAAVPGLIVCDVNFNFSCFVHIHRFCFPQVWCPIIVFTSSRHNVLLKFGLQDTLSDISDKVLQKCATLEYYYYHSCHQYFLVFIKMHTHMHTHDMKRAQYQNLPTHIPKLNIF